MPTTCASSASSPVTAARPGRPSMTSPTTARSDAPSLLLRFWCCRFCGLAGIVLARQFSRFHAYLRHGHFVIFRLRQPLQVLIEPADDVLQALHSVPRLAGA